MARKSFKNPSLQFLTQATEPETTPEPAPDAGAPSTGKRKAPAGYKPNPAYIETKSRRVQILLQPSLHEKAKRLSAELGISLNDLIHRALSEVVYDEYVQNLIRKDLKEEQKESTEG